MRIWLATVAFATLSCSRAVAQELEPRAYSPSPVGTTFVVAGVARSTGGVLIDPTLPIEDVDAKVRSLVIGAGYTFGLAGKQAIVLGAMPITWADVSGQVGENRASVSRRGLADPRLKFSVILAGSPARSPSEFARARPATIVGAAISVVPPWGQYVPEHLINLGSNRWSMKPEIGISFPRGHWTFEGYGGAWFFTANDRFYTGSFTRRQDPIAGMQAHVSYTIRPRAWAAFDATWYSGGRTNIDGVDKGDLQRNTRLGATVSLPIQKRQSLKVSYTAGAATRIGADFKTISVTWQLVTF
jgi:hypothetical protein